MATRTPSESRNGRKVDRKRSFIVEILPLANRLVANLDQSKSNLSKICGRSNFTTTRVPHPMVQKRRYSRILATRLGPYMC